MKLIAQMNGTQSAMGKRNNSNTPLTQQVLPAQAISGGQLPSHTFNP